jgi:hypothetical protein
MRSAFTVYVKIYFLMYLLSLPVFIAVPSRVLGFISSGNIQAVNPERIHLSENYFLVEQQLLSTAGSARHFKLVREMGMFHKTLARNIQLPVGTDSAKWVTTDLDHSIHFVVFYSDGDRTDSLEFKISTADQTNSSQKVEQKRFN